MNKKNKPLHKYTPTVIIEIIREDCNLKTNEKLLLIFLFSYSSSEVPPLRQVAQKTAISHKKAKMIIINLLQSNKYGQPLRSLLEKNNGLKKLKFVTEDSDKKQGLKNKLYNRPGSKIAREWSKIFGTTQLTPTNFNKLKTFIDDGIEEKVIIEVMKISAEKARGNPINYSVNILNNYLNRGIMTYEDFEQERRRREDYEQQVQKNNRAEEKRKELHKIQNLEEKGWNK